MPKRFYRYFYSTLPDEFVEANDAALARFAEGKDRPYSKLACVIDGVSVSLGGTGRFATIYCNSPSQITNWMNKHGDDYNGRYWEAFTQDHGGPGGKPSKRTVVRTGITTATWRSIPIATFDPIDPGQGAGLTAMVMDMMEATSQRILSTMSYGIRPAFNYHGLTVNIRDLSADPHPALRRDGIIAGEIIGHRCWLVITANGRPLLRSVYQSDFWQPNVPLEGRGLEDWDSRGIHAWKDGAGEHFFRYIREYMNNNDIYPSAIPTCPAMITGTVSLWGDVVEHEHGYRAEFARVRSLDWLYPDQSMMGREREVLAHLQSLYGVA